MNFPINCDKITGYEILSEVVMIEKDIADIRRRYRKDRSNISRIRACFVNEKKEIISEIDHLRFV